MILFINTTDFTTIHYALGLKGTKQVSGVFFEQQYQVDSHKSHELLGFLQKFFKKASIDLSFKTTDELQSGITKIVVCKGPGSYTGTRIGVTHALALGFSWSIPVTPLEKELFAKELAKFS